MKVVLVTVPHAPPFTPLLGPSLVAGELRQRGHRAVVIDGAFAALERLWSAEAIEAGVATLRAGLARHERYEQLSRSAAREYLDTARQILGAELVARAVEEALARLRGQAGLDGFLDADAYDRALHVLEAALRLSCAPFLPERATLRSYHPPSAVRTEADLLAHARRPASRALFGATLLEVLPRQILAAFEGAPPDAVGVSLAWPSQLGPAAMLGQGLRAAGYAGPIVWGGALMAHLDGDLGRSDQLARAGLVDAIVPSGGASALLRFLEAPASERRGGVLRVEEAPPASERALPAPDFEGLPLERYLAPRRVLPLLASIGCYWQRCAFCDHFHSMRAYRPRPVQAIVEDMKRLHAETGCRDFYLVDDCTPPRTLRGLAEALLAWRAAGGPEVSWMTECRAERALLAEGLLERVAASGCRMLLVGMESASDAVLKAMEKDVTRDQLGRVLDAVHAAGILTWCFFMVGFPGETADDARQTRDFLLEKRDVIDVVAGGPFVVTRHSPVAKDPSRFGVELTRARSKAPDYELTCPHRAAIPSDAERDRALEELKEHEQLRHYLHPLVVEAHGLFLGRSYYHREKSRLRPAGGGRDLKALLAATVSAAPGMSVQYFKFPTDGERLPASGKISAAPCAVLSRVDGDFVHASLPVATFFARCLSGPATVAARVQETVARGQGTERDVLETVVRFVERGYLLLS